MPICLIRSFIARNLTDRTAEKELLEDLAKISGPRLRTNVHSNINHNTGTFTTVAVYYTLVHCSLEMLF